MKKIGGKGLELWLPGTVSSLARKNLKAQGVKVIENAYKRMGIK